MPQIIQTIDHIARIKQRDVLFLSFYDHDIKKRLGQVSGENQSTAQQQWQDHRSEAWKTMPIRQQIIDWLDAQGIGWQPCGQFASSWMIMGGYVGDIYLDVPYDENLQVYQTLEAYLQFSDDTMRFENVMFFCLALEQAMMNAAQDESGSFEDL